MRLYPRKYAYGWHRWFAWYPIITIPAGTGNSAWVWLEPVERFWLSDQFMYRLPG